MAKKKQTNEDVVLVGDAADRRKATEKARREAWDAARADAELGDLRGIKFEGGFLELAGLKLRAPLAKGGPGETSGNITLFQRVQELLHADLEKAAAALGLPIHPAMPTYDTMLVVGGELQRAWFIRMHGEGGEYKVHPDHFKRVKEFRANAVRLSKGEAIVTKSKETKAAKTPKAKKPKVFQVVKYSATDKVNAEKHAKLLDKDNKAYAAVIVRALRGAKEPLTFPELMTATSGQFEKRDGKVNVEANVRWYLNDLRKRGLIKHSDEKVEAKSQDEARGVETAA